MNINGNEYFYITNLQGDIIELVDIDGNTVVKYKYDAWGNIEYQFDNSGVGLAEKNPYRYRGYRYDEETGWYYLQSRYYNPEIGRFINADGRLNPSILGKNMYAYTENNPVNYIDPHGTFSFAATLFASACFEAAAYTALFPGAGQVISAGLIVVGVTGAILIELNEQDALPPLLPGPSGSSGGSSGSPNGNNNKDDDDKEYNGLAPDGIKPPGYNEIWKIEPASRPSYARNGSKSYYDPSPNKVEWRYHKDRNHPAHWDYKKTYPKNSPWEKIIIDLMGQFFKNN